MVEASASGVFQQGLPRDESSRLSKYGSREPQFLFVCKFRTLVPQESTTMTTAKQKLAIVSSFSSPPAIVESNMNKKFTLLLVYHLKASFAWLEVQPHFSRRSSPLFSSTPEEAREMKEQAARLRKEVDSFESQKKAAESEEIRKQKEEHRAQQELREQYSAVVPILKPDGSTVDERCEFVPKWNNRKSFITVCESDLPLGIILGESEDFAGTTVVDEVAEGSNGQVAGIKEGDVVRAFTACRMEMEQPAWQLMAGGIGIPKTKRFMYSVDGRPFEEVMDAIGSNRLDPQGRPALLVIERRKDA